MAVHSEAIVKVRAEKSTGNVLWLIDAEGSPLVKTPNVNDLHNLQRTLNAGLLKLELD